MKMFSYLGYTSDHKVRTIKVPVLFEGKRFVAHDSVIDSDDYYTVTHKHTGLRIALSVDQFTACKLVKECDKATRKLPLLLRFMPWYKQAELIKSALIPTIQGYLPTVTEYSNEFNDTEAN